MNYQQDKDTGELLCTEVADEQCDSVSKTRMKFFYACVFTNSKFPRSPDYQVKVCVIVNTAAHPRIVIQELLPGHLKSKKRFREYIQPRKHASNTEFCQGRIPML